MDPVRIYGDPFGPGPASRALRAFLEVARDGGLEPSICLPVGSTPLPDPAGPETDVEGEGPDGGGGHPTGGLEPAMLQRLHEGLAAAVPSTAPVVVFDEPNRIDDALKTAALLWSDACRVVAGGRGFDPGSAWNLVERVRVELRWAGTEDAEGSQDATVLQAYADLPVSAAADVVLHVGFEDTACGSDLAVRAFAAGPWAATRRMRVVLSPGSEVFRQRLLAQARCAAPAGIEIEHAFEFVDGPLRPEHLADCAVVLQPLRAVRGGEPLAQLLASGRPVLLTRTQKTSTMLHGAPVVAWLAAQPTPEDPSYVEPVASALGVALQTLLADPEAAAQLAERARRFAMHELVHDRPASPARPVPNRREPTRAPHLVLEAPFLTAAGVGADAIALARALQARGNVDVELVPTKPFSLDVRQFGASYPDLVGAMGPRNTEPELWLSWRGAFRSVRPRGRRFAFHADSDFRTLGVDCPVACTAADAVVTPTQSVADALSARFGGGLQTVVVPVGIDPELAAMLPQRPQRRPQQAGGPSTVALFFGGCNFIDGFDIALRAILQANLQGRFVEWVVCSEGRTLEPQFEELLQRATALLPGSAIRVVGGRLSPADRLALYEQSDLLLMPRRGGSAQTAVAEALACGLPVLTTESAAGRLASSAGLDCLPAERRDASLDTPCLSTPWLVDCDADAVCEALVRFADRVALWSQVATRHAVQVLAECSWEAVAEQVEALCLPTSTSCATSDRKAALTTT
jgi:glycosyltransferase involved in cell wall biosynthesis